MGKRRPKTRQDTRRRKGQINVQRALIVTEGSKTEPNYFRKLIRELCLTTRVEINGEGGSAPISVVEHAENLLKNDPDFEHVFLVFDRDRHQHYDEALEKAKNIKPRKPPKKQNIMVIPSIPCFEIWFFIHVSESRKPYSTGEGVDSPANDLIGELKNSHSCFAKYKKGNCDNFYDVIRPMQETACSRAEMFLEEANKDGYKIHYENPSTRAHLVVRKLQDMAPKNRRRVTDC